MITFSNHRLKNVVLYDRAEIDLDYVGTTVIRGKNLNVKKGQKRSNGSGKSLLTATISQVVGYSAPAAQSSKRTQHKDLLSDGSEILTILNSGEDEYRIIQSMGKDVEYQVVKNGVTLDPKGIKSAHQLLRDIVPLTDEEWYTFGYLDSRRHFPLHLGTATQRFEFLINMFQLDKHDDKLKAINARLNDIKHLETKRDTLQLQADEQREVLAEEKPDIEPLEEELEGLQDKVQDIKSQLSDLELYNKFKVIKQELDEIKAQHGSMKEIRQKFETLSEGKEAYQSYLAAKRLLTGWKEKWDRLEAQSQATNPYGDLTLKETRERYSSDRDKKARLTEEFRGMKDSMPDELDEPESVEKPDSPLDQDRLSVVQSEIAKINTVLQNVEDSEDGLECSECGMTYTGEALVKHQQKLEKQRATLKKELAHLIGLRDGWKSYNLFEQQYQHWENTVKQRAELKTRLKSLKEKIEKISLDAEDWIEQETARQHLLANKPVVKKVEFDQETYSQLERAINLYKSYQPVVDRLKDVNPDIPAERLTQRLEKLTKRVKELQTIIPGLRAKEQYRVETLKRVKKLREQVKELNSQTACQEDLRVLASAYGKKGFRQTLIQRLVSTIEQNLNQNSHLLFPEAFTFEFIVGDNQFDILVHRNGTGKPSDVSDVRFLSGAEGRAFNLLCSLSILPLIDSARRLNIIILDEMDNGMDMGAKELWANHFLPALNEIVPHIIVVTPLSDVAYLNSRTFFAVKRGDKTTLVAEDG